MICHLSELNNIKLKKNNRVRPPNFWREVFVYFRFWARKRLFFCVLTAQIKPLGIVL